MAIDSIAPGMTMDRSSSELDTTGGDGETRPAGDENKGRTTDGDQGAVCLKNLLREAAPEYLTLSLTPTRAAAKYRRQKRPVEVSLAYVDAPRDYLSLSVTPSDQPKRRRGLGRHHMSGGGGGSAASSVAEGAPVVVEAVIPPPSLLVQIAATCLPPKKPNLAAAGVYQETAGTAPVSSSPCLALEIVNQNDGVSPSSSSPATMESHPIDAVPLQAVYVHGGVSRPLSLGSSSAEEITINEAAAEPPAAEGQAKQSRLM